MILKASRRAGSKQLSDHLLNTQSNEHVFVEEVRGFMTQNLDEALQEIYVQAKAKANPKVKKFMLSVSINPPKDKTASKKSMVEAADQIEKKLELQGQPRVIVFHEKQGRRHAHVVFNLMDENLKIIKLDFYKKRLNNLARELFLEHGWDLPKGFKNKQERDITSYGLSEAHAAERNKLNPKELKARLQQCWEISSNLETFKQALSKEGYQLAKGDRRGFVLVNMHGNVSSLSRTLSLKVKDVKAKLGDSQQLQSVEDAKQAITETQKAQLIKTQAQLEQRHEAQLVPLKTQLFDMKIAHRKGREDLSEYHSKRQTFELAQRQKQYQSGIKKVWLYISGQYHHLKKKHEAEYQASLVRDEQEKEALIQTQLKARHDLQQPLEVMIKQHQSQLLQLRSGIAHRAIAQEANINLTEGFNANRGHVQSPEKKRHHTQELEL